MTRLTAISSVLYFSSVCAAFATGCGGGPSDSTPTVAPEDPVADGAAPDASQEEGGTTHSDPGSACNQCLAGCQGLPTCCTSGQGCACATECASTSDPCPKGTQQVWQCEGGGVLCGWSCVGESSSGPADAGSGGEDASTSSEDANVDAGGNDSDDAGPDPSCAAMDATACYSCCETAYSEGSQTFWNTLETCACNSPGACSSECGSNWCAGDEASSACETCLGNSEAMSGACNSPIVSACAADANCVEYVGCMNACPAS
jgi:hypothetical protein